jgi:hypothetical protein
MKFITVLACTAVALNGALAADIPVIPSSEVMKSVQNIDLPAGISFVGTAEPLKEPKKEELQEALTIAHDNKEQFLGRWGGLFGGGLYGPWAGWGLGGFLPYRFGFNCGGLGGWAYPLGYWNTFGAGLYGGSCGLGLAHGGLFYC